MRRGGDAAADRGACRRGQDRARRARRARAAERAAGADARGEGLGARAGVCLRRRAPAAGAGHQRTGRARGPVRRRAPVPRRACSGRTRAVARAGGDGFEALHSLYWLVVNLADRGPLAVLVDDCQWADRDSLRFLGLPGAADRGAAGRDGARRAAGRRGGGRGGVAVGAGRVPSVGDRAVSAAAQRVGRGARWPGSVWARKPPRSSAARAIRRPAATRCSCASCCERSRPRGWSRPAAAAGAVQAVGPAAVSRFVLHRLAALGASATELARAVAVLGDGSEPELATRVSGLTEAVARDAADALVRADIFARGERLGFVHPIVRAALYEDLAPGERQARHAAAAEALARAGASPERVTAHLLLTPPTGDPRAGADAAVGGRRRGASRRSGRRRRVPAPGARRVAGRAAARRDPRDLGRYEVAAMQFEAAEEHLRACLASGADLATRADAAATLGRCAVVVRRALRGGGGRCAGVAGRGAWPGRPGARARAGLRAADGRDRRPAPACRLLPGQLQRFRDQAAGSRPSFEAVARIYGAQEQLVARRLARPPQRRRPRRRSPPACRRATETTAGLSGAVHAAARRAARPGGADARRRAGARPARGPRDPTGHHPRPARRDRARAGVAARRAGRGRDRAAGWCTSAHSCSRCCSRWPSRRTSNAGPWATRSSWPGGARRSS